MTIYMVLFITLVYPVVGNPENINDGFCALYRRLFVVYVV